MQDFYKRLIKDEIYEYSMIKDSLDSLTNEIEELKAKKESKVVANYGIQPVSGGGNSQEDKLININTKIWLLEKNKKEGLDKIVRIESAMRDFSDKEKDILLGLYGNCGRRDGQLERLKAKYNYGKSQLYAIANNLIEKMSYRLYGKA